MRRETLVQARHLERLALVYVRQSTLVQVREHRESTRLLYGMEQRAEELGWPRDRIRALGGPVPKTRTESVRDCLDAEFTQQLAQGGIGQGPSRWRWEHQV